MNCFKTFIALLLITGSSLALAQIEWLEPGNNDLRAERLAADVRSVPASMHHESAAIHFAWSAEQATAGREPAGGPTMTDTTPSAVSRQYWLDVTGADLAGGVDLPLTASGAVVRISALHDRTGLQLDPAELELVFEGRRISADFGPGDVRTGTDLRDEGMSVPEDTLAFRLTERTGPGTLQVAHGGLEGDLALVINVYEPESPWVARLTLPRHTFLAGQSLEFDFSLGNGRQTVQPDSVQAVLASPDASESWPISQARDGGLVIAEAPMAASARAGQGLYEAHVYVEAEFRGQTIRRDLTLALNIAPATARFNGEVQRGRSDGLALELGIDHVVAGRYQVNAEVLGTNARGDLEVAGYVQSAAVLEAGRGHIVIELDGDHLRSSGLGEPFEIRNLQLLDQGRMYLLEDRARALRIDR